MKLIGPLALIVLFAFESLPAAAAGPSFNCGNARQPDEITICENPVLAELDTIVAAGYGYLKVRYGRPFADQIGIPTWRSRQACLADANCIRQRQIDAINADREAGAPVAVPAWALSTQTAPSNPSIGTTEPSADTDSASSEGLQPATRVSPDEGVAEPVSVPVQMHGGTFVVPITINGRINLDFTIDSGASSVVIPADVFMTLVRSGTINDGDLTGKKTFQLADGSTQTQDTFLIRSLQIGDRVLHDVDASVAPPAGELLLGQSFLHRFRSWSIDNQRGLLVLN